MITVQTVQILVTIWTPQTGDNTNLMISIAAVKQLQAQQLQVLLLLKKRKVRQRHSMC